MKSGGESHVLLELRWSHTPAHGSAEDSPEQFVDMVVQPSVDRSWCVTPNQITDELHAQDACLPDLFEGQQREVIRKAWRATTIKEGTRCRKRLFCICKRALRSY